MKVCCIAIACLILAGCAGVQQALDETEHAATAGEADSSKLASLNAEIAQQPAEESTTVEEKETRADEANVDEAKADEANVDEPAAQSAADPASGLAVEEESAAVGAQAATAGGGADAAVVAAATALTCAEDTGARSKSVDHSETETTTGAAAAPEPLPPPLPDPLDRRQINRLVFSEIGEGLIPVHRSGTALYLLHDIDSNGYNDVFALAVRVDQPAEAEFANINDYTRLYRADRSAVGFYLCLFHQRSGTLFPADLIFLGERMVVDSFRPQAIVEGENTPFAVSVVFTTLQGRVQEWVIFSGGTPGRFSIQERSGELFRVEDIDKDGVIDVVIYEEIYEVGVGNETYLTWYEWDGREFSSRATVNVVRNLRQFLKAAFDAIRGKNWDKFSEHGLG